MRDRCGRSRLWSSRPAQDLALVGGAEHLGAVLLEDTLQVRRRAGDRLWVGRCQQTRTSSMVRAVAPAARRSFMMKTACYAFYYTRLGDTCSVIPARNRVISEYGSLCRSPIGRRFARRPTTPSSRPNSHRFRATTVIAIRKSRSPDRRRRCDHATGVLARETDLTDRATDGLARKTDLSGRATGVLARPWRRGVARRPPQA